MIIDHPMPWQVRWHLRRTGHELARFNRGITVPLGSFDRGWLIVCDCGKVWAW